MRIVRKLFLISLVLLTSVCLANTEELLRKMDRASTREMVQDVLAQSKGELTEEEIASLQETAAGDSWKDVRDSFPSILRARSLTQSEARGAVGAPRDEALRILKNPKYRDTDRTTNKNWISNGFEQFMRMVSEWIAKLLRAFFDSGANINAGPGALNFMPIASVVLWILGLALVGFAAYFLYQLKFAPKRKVKKAGGLLDEEEPDRTVDEWLTLADELEAGGKYREAVRCLYVACLMRLDEALVMRFVRGETNWEHLRRFESSSRRPSALDFRASTQRFDLVWYGGHVKGSEDVAYMKSVYSQILQILAGVAA